MKIEEKTLVYCDNEKEFNELQDILFSEGYKWVSRGKKKLKLPSEEFGGGVIIYISSSTYLTYDMFIDVSKEDLKYMIMFNDYKKSRNNGLVEIEEMFDNIL